MTRCCSWCESSRTSSTRCSRRTPQHPSLRFKRVKRFHSVRVGAHSRALAVDVADGLLRFWIGSHAEYDRLVAYRRLVISNSYRYVRSGRTLMCFLEGFTGRLEPEHRGFVLPAGRCGPWRFERIVAAAASRRSVTDGQRAVCSRPMPSRERIHAAWPGGGGARAVRGSLASTGSCHCTRLYSGAIGIAGPRPGPIPRRVLPRTPYDCAPAATSTTVRFSAS